VTVQPISEIAAGLDDPEPTITWVADPEPGAAAAFEELKPEFAPADDGEIDAYFRSLNEPAHAADGIDDPTATLAEFVARKSAESEALVESDEGPIIAPAGLVLVVSKSGAGKTTTIDDFMLHAASGVDWCGLTFPRPLRVLFIENEGPREAFRQKIERRLMHWTPADRGATIRIWDDPARWGQIRLSNAGQLSQLRSVIERHRIDLCISDTLTRFGMKGNGTPEETREFVELMTTAGLGRDVAFMLLHHPLTRPDQTIDELERIAGAWPPHADTILSLQKLPGNRTRLSFPKLRWARGQRTPSILAFDPEKEAFTFVAAENSENDDRDILAELTEALADGDWKTVNALRQPPNKGGIGARDEAIKDGLANPRFESAKGEDIGKRRAATYYRLRNPHAGQHDNPHQGPVGHVRQLPPRVPDEEPTPTSHPQVSGGTGGCGFRDTPAGEDLEWT
jgi:hypothetical protein